MNDHGLSARAWGSAFGLCACRDDRGGSGGQVKGWRCAAAHRRRDKPGRLLPCALRRVLLPLAPKAPAHGGSLLRSRHPRYVRIDRQLAGSRQQRHVPVTTNNVPDSNLTFLLDRNKRPRLLDCCRAWRLRPGGRRRRGRRGGAAGERAPVRAA